MTLARMFGPRLERGAVTFRLWAPAATTVDLVVTEPAPMARRGDGWFELTLATAGPGTQYRFRIDGALEVPDPASAFQPHDVGGASEVIDHDNYAWREQAWRGRPWHEAVTLELHVGAFTPGGTFLAAIDRLDDIKAAGFTAIELMPVADFFGRWNWGYDGVLLFAPDSAYGRPEHLKALVDAAHQRGLMIFLDVVYNHFGPEGNYLGRYAPAFFSRATATPWGAAIDYEVTQVRAFAIENALHWLAHYRFDGLRLDAVHAIVNRGQPSILTELSRAVGEFAASSGRHIHLILENDDNDAGLLDPQTDPPHGKYRAQWNDDYHHAWHVLLTGEAQGYYRDYTSDAGAHIARVLGCGFAYQGEPSLHRGGKSRGEPSGHLSPTAFVSFLQNHDQIGNRARGERLDALAPRAAIEAALAITLLAPMPPLMFMGEEWGSRRPFPFFCDFTGGLADAVREGRRREFAESSRGDDGAALPDALAEATFRSAKLDWPARDAPEHQRRLDLVSRLLSCRRREISPRLADLHGTGRAEWDAGLLTAEWRLGNRVLSLIANLSPRQRHWPAVNGVVPLWGRPPTDVLSPWFVSWGWKDG